MNATQAELFGEFDHVIVGGGTAGCLLANRLSADPARRVLMIEAGPRDDWHWIHIPVGYLYCIGNPRTDWCYHTEPEPGLNGRSILYARGRVLGGCSSINAMIYMRGQAADYDHWAALTGDASWSWKNVLPLFRQTEDYHAGADEAHGSGGEWRVEPQRLSWEILDAVRDAMVQAGVPRSEDFNRGDNEGCGYFRVNQKRGVRWNASKAFLRGAAGRPNLTVLTGALVQRLSFDGRRCTGVEFRHGGRLRQARSRQETVLAAGAIGSPQILQLSGIGDPNHLRSLGINPVHALPGVGENLQDHLQLRMAFEVSGVTTLNQRVHSLWGKAAMAFEYALRRTGPLTMAPSQFGGFTRSSAAQDRPNLQFHVQPLSLDKFGEPLHRFAAFTISVCNLRPASRGQVRIRAADAAQAPMIRPRYLSAEEDRAIAVEALRLTRRIAAMPALARYMPQEFVPGPAQASDEELVHAAGNIGTTIFHPVGTCRMGTEDDPRAVVDAQLRVRGLAGLRVIDASIMPTITSGNTCSPTVMIAEKGAAMLLHSRP